MIRFFITMLLITVIFLAGMLLGMDRNLSRDSEMNNNKTEHIKEKYKQAEQKELLQSIDNDVAYVNSTQVQEPTHFTQKIAAALEKVVKVFYEIVVQLLYQITQLFY